MKYLFFALLLQSCAMMEFEATYYADSAGTYKCEPVIADKYIGSFERYDESMLKEIESYGGYEGCKYKEKTDSYIVISCSSPFAYERIASKKPAQCQKFMADNNIRIVK